MRDRAATGWCGHVSDLLSRRLVPLAVMPIADASQWAQSDGVRGLIAIILVASGALAAFAWANQPSLNNSERDLFGRLDRVASGGNPSPSSIVQAFGLPAECGQRSCFFNQPEATNSGFATGNLRPGADGLVFVLERPRGQCIRVDRVAAHFGAREPHQACADSECWYVEARHEWGLLGFGLETRGATCVASVVINTASDQRPRQHVR